MVAVQRKAHTANAESVAVSALCLSRLEERLLHYAKVGPEVLEMADFRRIVFSRKPGFKKEKGPEL